MRYYTVLTPHLVYISKYRVVPRVLWVGWPLLPNNWPADISNARQAVAVAQLYPER